MRRPIDILLAGELYVDFATAEFAQTLDEAFLFKRAPGGNPANLAIQMARLGNKCMLAACVGNDDMGKVLLNHLSKVGIDTACVAHGEEPTSLMLSTRSANSHNVQAYRGADAMLSIRQFPFQSFENIGVFHTTCFSLSKNPSRQVILQAAERAQRAGCLLSMDVNYSEKIFPDRMEAKKLVTEICHNKALARINDTGWKQLYEDEASSPEAVVEHFLKIGAAEVCYSNEQGHWVGNAQEFHAFPRRQNHGDTGESFWAGYLTARLDGKLMFECAIAGRRMAELYQTANLSREQIYEELVLDGKA